jgi:Holliday junction resolvase RusA-like endonuclease
MRKTFIIPGEPVAKARPRVMTNGITYTPAKTKNYETLVKELYWTNFQGKELLTGPIQVRIDAFFQIPKSASKVMRERMIQGLERPTKRPDGDNILKAVTDALNGIAYVDDSAIVSAQVRKWWSETPRVQVTLETCEAGRSVGE